jgi:hypothetical protein
MASAPTPLDFELISCRIWLPMPISLIWRQAMRAKREFAALSVVVLLCTSAAALAQSGQVPSVIRFNGVAATGQGPTTITFGIYAEQVGGEPLWSEVHTVTLDSAGRYAVLLGSATPDGLPVSLFESGDARWIGVKAGDAAELPRVALISVPYAIKAGDATTIGGKPLSAFLLAGNRTGRGADGLTYVDARVLTNGLTNPAGGSAATAGTTNYIGMFTDTSNLGNSAIFQAASGRVGINTTVPFAPFAVVANETPGVSVDVYSGSPSTVLGALPLVYRAARGTSALPSAVQADDILGGLAVRAYGSTKFSGGRGQVMFKAAETWTDGANGTYLSFATEPIGASTIAAERMRIAADGKVGIGTTAPGQLLSVGGVVESLSGGFKFPDGTVQTSAAPKGTLTSSVSGFGDRTLTALTTGYGLAAFGDQALRYNTTGDSNSALGSRALLSNTTGSANTAVGTASLIYNTTGGFNTAVGNAALQQNTTGLGNTAVGSSASRDNTTGNLNTAIGDAAALSTTTGGDNVAVGGQALKFNTISAGNTAVGVMSLLNTTSAAVGEARYNSAVGHSAGDTNTTGAYNTFIGANADAATGATGLTNAAAIGANAVVGQSNALVLGGLGANAVNVGIGTSTPGSTLTAVGVVESTTGGFKFPDGTTQTSAGLKLSGGTIAANTAGTTPGVTLNQTGTAQGLKVNSTYSDAVHAESTNGGYGVYGKATGADAVRGEATNARGVMGWSTNSTGVYGLTDATTAPSAGVMGAASSAAYGVYGTNSGSGPGVYGVNLGTGYGVHADQQSATINTTALFARNSGRGYAARFEAANPASHGVTIIAPAPGSYAALFVNNTLSGGGLAISGTTAGNGTGVSGSSVTGTGLYGTSGSGGIGVYGYNETNEAIRGYSLTGKAVYAWANGAGTGLHAKSVTGIGASIESGVTSDSGYALNAVNTGGGHASHFSTGGVNAFAIWASNTGGGTAILSQGNSGGQGMVGLTDSGSGVLGMASTSGSGVYGESFTGYGVEGFASGATAYAGYFTGKVNVTGNLTVVGTKSFRIDHPLDPLNKYLQHAAVESSDVKNMYDGVAVLDEAGEAWVTLPVWFEALNGEFRYQLTPMGAPFVPYVAEELAGNRFKIAGGMAGRKVSWQVTGIRHDAYAAAHPMEVEPAKPATEQGKYLAPEAYGQPPDTGIGFRSRPVMPTPAAEPIKQ